MRITRNSLFGAAAALALAGLAGCPSPPAPTPGGASAPGGQKPFRVALVVDTGGIDDRSFNAAANEGRKRAQAEFGLDDQHASLIQSKAKADYKTNLTLFANQGY